MKEETPGTPAGFAYHQTEKRYVSLYQDGIWQPGRLTADAIVRLNESACVLQYAQTCFEGLKAYRTADNRLVCFRPDLNEQRLHDSCLRMMMPPLPDGMFLEAVRKVVKANRRWVPAHESGGSLYLRPVIFGTNPVLGVKPATEFQFRLFASPVGSYFSGGVRPLHLRICDLDRAAPHGTGHIKAGLNYAMSLYAISEAHALGYDENLYLDSATRTYIEETGGANVIFVTKDGTLVTPRSDTILPSITRRSLLYVAEHYLEGRGAPRTAGRAGQLFRVRPVRHRGRHLSRGDHHRPWHGPHLPRRRGDLQAVQHAAGHPARDSPRAGGLDHGDPVARTSPACGRSLEGGLS